MKVKINEGKIVIDPYDLLQELKGEDKIRLIDDLSCQNEVIKHVSDQIIHGCTERGSHGSMGSATIPSTPLDKAVREVSENSSDIAKKEISRLTRRMQFLEESKIEAWDKYHDLENSIRNNSREYFGRI